MSSYRYDNVTCSQCGKDLGPGDHGVSSCHRHQEHQAERRVTGRRETDALQATAYQSLMGKKLAEQQRDKAIDALRKISRVDYRASLKGLDCPTEFAESQARGFAIGHMQEIALKALKQIGGAA